MKMMIKKPAYYLFILMLLFAYGCSNTKYLPDGEKLYVGGEVKVEDSLIPKKQRKAMQEQLNGLLRPKPNSALLGLRIKLWIYNIAGKPKKDKGFKHWLKNKVGEAPVLFSQVDMDYNSDVLQNSVENQGYFKAITTSDSTSSNKRAKAIYTVKPGPQYKIRNVIFPTDSTSTPLDSLIAKAKRRTLLKPGRPYDLDVIKSERERIDQRLKNRGYFYFNPDYILVRVDSTVGKHEVDLKVIVKEDTPLKAKQAYKISNIFIYPNYSLSSIEDTVKAKNYTQYYKDLKIIDSTNTFRPIIYDRTMFFHKGDIYSRKDHNLSLNRLVNLNVFKFVKNEFRPSDSLKNGLDVYYYLTPMPKKSIRFETLAKTNSANYTGSELNVNWSNRNAFKAAELLTVTAFGAFEVQMSGQNKGYNVYRLGSEVSLQWPRFISPIKIADSSAYVPRTRTSIGYEYQNRQRLYALNSFTAKFGYLWKDRLESEKQLDLIEVNFVNPSHVTQEYLDDIEENPSLQHVIDKQLIFGPTYSYTYTNTMRKQKKHTFYYKGSVDLAGNIAGLIGGANVKKGDTLHVFEVPFSQYIKTEQDLRYYLKLGKKSQWANRLIVGAGMPYGNSGQLPYVKQFFTGGTNSLRAFRARSVGPGTYRPENIDSDSFLPDQSGDIKLEMNTEYRANLFSVIYGAAFVDAGNIWLWNKDPQKPGAEFSSDFLNQLAVGSGVGLRVDISLLVIRLDVAFPIRKPWLPEGQRWVIDDIDFGSNSWRKENLVFNLAIGYPF